MVVAERERRPRLLVDVTQFVSWPAASGIQRVLLHLAEQWRGEDVEAVYGFIGDGRFVTGPIAALGRQIASVFRSFSVGAPVSSDVVRRALTDTSERSFPVDNIERAVDSYLLPEPTLRADSLEVAARLHTSTETIPFFIHYDALPLTQPQFFAPRSDGGLVVTRYHRTLAQAANIAFISQTARDAFESRIARQEVLNGIVARPGADGLGRAVSDSPAKPSFVTVGTVEPRKRHRLMLEAFERLWSSGRDFRFVILGGAGWEEPGFVERLRELSATPRLKWVERPNDDVIAEELSRASAMLYPSEFEGYGLPPLEALALGCPVVASAGLPSLDGLPSHGQIRLPEATVDGLMTAVETLADSTSNAGYRRGIAELRLPTWERFTTDVESWIASEVGHTARSDVNPATKGSRH